MAHGVVDILAIRKDTSLPSDPMLKSHDLFDIVLVQCKGGGARAPTDEDIRRLRRVAKVYRAKAVVLFEWRRGQTTMFKTLPPRGNEWIAVAGKDVFG